MFPEGQRVEVVSGSAFGGLAGVVISPEAAAQYIAQHAAERSASVPEYAIAADQVWVVFTFWGRPFPVPMSGELLQAVQ